MNSKGAVPALQFDDGRVLTEGPASFNISLILSPNRGWRREPADSSATSSWKC